MFAEALKSGRSTGLSAEELSVRLGQLSEEGKTLTQRFNTLYDEFSRISLRAGPAMYRVERPVEIQTVRTLTLGAFGLLVLGTFLLAAGGTTLAAFAYEPQGCFVS